MAINVGLTLFLLVLAPITVRCKVSQEHMSTENINEILDKLILQTHLNETGSIADLKDLTPIVETQPGNDSNIYYFKKFVKPHINFKSSNENLQAIRHPNNTAQSMEVFNEDHHATSEDELLPGVSKITRKSFIVENQKHFMPRLVHGGQERQFTEFQERAGYVDENDYSLEDLIKKEIVSDLSATNNNKQKTITQLGHQNQQSGLLHEYPEIIIDHITYDNDEDDENKIVEKNSTHDPQPAKNVVKEENNEVQTERPYTPKSRYTIPEEEIETAEHDSSEYVGSRNNVTPDMKGLIDTIIQKKVMQDALLIQTTEHESRKQNMLLEKILQRLPQRRQMTNNVKTSYSHRHERIAPTEIEIPHKNAGNHIHKSYSNVPLMPNKWETYNRLLRTLVRMCRPDILKRTRLVAGLLDRIMPNIDYRPMYYDLYKK